jgi:putative DNA primase/helicase
VDNSLLAAADVLSKDDFYRDAHQRVFLAIRALAGQEVVIDLVSLRDELQRRGDLDEVGGPAYVASLIDGVPRGTNVQHYARVVRECSTLRALIARVDALRALAFTRQTDLIDGAVRDIVIAAADVSANRSGTRAETPILVNMADIERQDVRWLWANRLALGAMTLLAAEPGIGKSWLSLEIAARLTTNRELPGGPALGERVDVLIMAAEDAPETTIRSRLQSLGADMRRVHFFVDKVHRGQREAVRLADTAVIERAAVATGAKLLIIDPMNSFMTGDVYNDLEVRKVLTPLLRVARDRDLSILGLMHQTKNTASQAIYRTLGSIGFNGIARVVLNVVTDKDDPRRRWLITIKNNLGHVSHDRDGIAYVLSRNRVVWDTSQRVDYDALLNAQTIGKDAPEQVTAAEFLQALLSDEREKWPLNAAATIDMARRNGISPTALQRARRSFGIQSRKQGFGKQAEWRWYKPRGPRQSPKETPAGLPHGARSSRS